MGNNQGWARKGKTVCVRGDNQGWARKGNTVWVKGNNQGWARKGKTVWVRGNNQGWARTGRTVWVRENIQGWASKGWARKGKTVWVRGSNQGWASKGKTAWIKGNKQGWTRKGKTVWVKGNNQGFARNGTTVWVRGNKEVWARKAKSMCDYIRHKKMGVFVYKLLMCAVLTVSAIAQLDARPTADSLPHIIFIVADDLGWNDVNWRAPDMHTPTLNKLAQSGIILNNSYVQPLCSPSRSAFMSGYFPFHTGLQHGVIMPQQQAYLPGNLTTLPEALKTLGYAAHAVGKWHLGFCNWKYTPTYRGFDSFLGYYNAAEDYYTHHVGIGYDFRNNKNVDREDEGKYSAYLFADRALDILKTHNQSQPLFLYLPFQSVHGPLEVPEVYETMYCSKTKNESRRTKCGMVAILDEAIGNITSYLESTTYMDNLLIIFTTDNGGPVWDAGNNWPLRGAKATLWEGGSRGTGFIYSKTLINNKGTVHNGLMHAVDWFPTIMSIVGGEAPPGIDGVSQWESLLNGSPSPRTEFVYNIDEMLKNAAIRSGDWKLIQGSPASPAPYNGWYPVPGVDDAAQEDEYQPDDFQLYNIKYDPTEHNDLKQTYPAVLAWMKARLEEWKKSLVPAMFPPGDPASNPKNYHGVWSPGWC
ncbi:hypothetical protein BaRGS_00027248 [Batillaria attramentaria]|uniref:Sulfatase N-terminal domain-containing protein n=1 Tax=Batillaria attramentaria TaxID=370345 RepID=A0ABD0K3R3_9CAEN